MKKIHLILKILFFATFCLVIIITNLNRPKIFILYGGSPTSYVNENIKKGMERNFNRYAYYRFKSYYLDVKDGDYHNELTRAYEVRKMIRKWSPDILICIDDNAQNNVGKYFVNDKNIDIIFSGVETPIEVYGYDKANNVTGIFRPEPLEAFKKLIMKMPDKKKFYFITDSSVSSFYSQKRIDDFNWEPIELIKNIQCSNFEEWKSSIQEAQNNADFIVVYRFDLLIDVNRDSALKWLEEHSKIPYFSLRDTGGVITMTPSPLAEGEEIVEMGTSILEENKKTNDLPIIDIDNFIIFMRAKKMQEFNVVVPDVYVDFAKTINTYSND